MQIYKNEPPELAHRQRLFFDSIRCGPEGVRSCGSSSYIYDYARGKHPPYDSIDTVIGFMSLMVWDKKPLSGETANAEKYLLYLNKFVVSVPDRVSATIRCGKYTPCLTHGDLTHENIVVSRSGKITLIDAGMTRDMSCKENDIAKLIQGYTLSRHSGDALTHDSVCTTVLGLTWTHLARLCRHPEKNSTRKISKARAVMVEIEGLLSV